MLLLHDKIQRSLLNDLYMQLMQLSKLSCVVEALQTPKRKYDSHCLCAWNHKICDSHMFLTALWPKFAVGKDGNFGR